MADPETPPYPCATWADCLCKKDGCSAGCKCEDCPVGSVRVSEVEEAKKTDCPWAECSCGSGCRCGAGCACVKGGDKKTVEKWVEWIKAKKAAESPATS